ncbi:MAG: diguanylate cyclase, partial [Sideroxydans sp.]|nr:diguanylate cyclase [Sideroxydans sp.]
MADNDISWFSEAHINKLFSHFPLPLAILDGAGSVKLLNRLFTDIFDASILQTDALQAVLRQQDANGQTLALTNRDGAQITLRARVIKVENFVVLIMEMSDESSHFAELAELHLRLAELEKLSSTDRLTGAWNRTHFDKTVSAELSRSVRYKQPVSLIFFDIDHFKHVNDTYGHAVGDVALRELVKVIWKNIRNSDMLFRWGGEEFVLIAPSTSYRAASGLAETLRAKVEKHPIEQVGHINISLGVAEHLTGESCDVWFQRADAALYQAKNSGRNRVIVDPHGSSDLWEAETGSTILHLTWHDSYECGEPTIDNEHHRLFDLSNVLIDAS